MPDLCFQDGQKVLFIGDSITDCGRISPAAPFGDGYFSMLRDLVTWGWPERRITWVNKGISGNRVGSLQERWEDDVIREAPDWLGVLIGINDCGVYYGGDPAERPLRSPAKFKEVYDEILSRMVKKIKPKLILATPFYMSTDQSGQSNRSDMLKLLPQYLSTVEEMAQKYQARLVRLQAMFERQLSYRSPDEFCPEPVHPHRSGHLLIAQEILKVLCE